MFFCLLSCRCRERLRAHIFVLPFRNEQSFLPFDSSMNSQPNPFSTNGSTFRAPGAVSTPSRMASPLASVENITSDVQQLSVNDPSIPPHVRQSLKHKDDVIQHKDAEIQHRDQMFKQKEQMHQMELQAARNQSQFKTQEMK